MYEETVLSMLKVIIANYSIFDLGSIKANPGIDHLIYCSRAFFQVKEWKHLLWSLYHSVYGTKRIKLLLENIKHPVR